MIEVLFNPEDYKVYMWLDKDLTQYIHFLKIDRHDEYHFEKVLTDHEIEYVLYMAATLPCYMAFKSVDDLNIAKLLY
jgi:hypothetical protein